MTGPKQLKNKLKGLPRDLKRLFWHVLLKIRLKWRPSTLIWLAGISTGAYRTLASFLPGPLPNSPLILPLIQGYIYAHPPPLLVGVCMEWAALMQVQKY